MTRHKKLSSLSIAATALLAASVPCFAQTQSVESSDETSTQVAMAVEQPVLAMNRERATAETFIGMENVTAKSPTGITASAKRPSLSAAMFMQPASQFSNSETQRFLAPRPTSFESGVDDSRNQFRVDDYDGSSPRKRIEFVPSRGPKPPL